MLEQQKDHDPGLPEFPVVLRGYDRTEVDDYLRRLAQWAADERYRAETASKRGEAAVGEARQLRDRIASLEREVSRSSSPSWTALGDEAAALFRKASQAAAELEQKAGEQTEAAVAEARQAAQRILDTANAKAKEMEESAARQRDAAERILGGAKAEAEAKANRLRAAAEAEAEAALHEAREQAVKIVVEAEESRRGTLNRLDNQRVEVEAQINQLVERREALLDELDRLREVLDSVTAHLRSRAAHQLFDGLPERREEPATPAPAPPPEEPASGLHIPPWLNEDTPSSAGGASFGPSGLFD